MHLDNILTLKHLYIFFFIFIFVYLILYFDNFIRGRTNGVSIIVPSIVAIICVILFIMCNRYIKSMMSTIFNDKQPIITDMVDF